MKFTALLTLVASASTILAAAITKDTYGNCPNYDATQLVQKYISILEHQPNNQQANQTAQALLVNNYQETSDSIATLTGVPFTKATPQGKQYYISGIFSNPAYTDIQTILITQSCQYITWHWSYNSIGNRQYRVKGFHIFTVASNGYQLQSAILEFNTVAWGVDNGYVTLFPGQNCTNNPKLSQAPLKRSTYPFLPLEA